MNNSYEVNWLRNPSFVHCINQYLYTGVKILLDVEIFFSNNFAWTRFRGKFFEDVSGQIFSIDWSLFHDFLSRVVGFLLTRIVFRRTCRVNTIMPNLSKHLMDFKSYDLCPFMLCGIDSTKASWYFLPIYMLTFFWSGKLK